MTVPPPAHQAPAATLPRLPPGIPALMVALAPALVVLGWNRLEELALELTGSDGGPLGLAIPIALFAAAFVAAIPLLRMMSRRPVLDGAFAGLLVAAVMVVVLVRIVATLGPGNGPLVLIVGLPFYALAIGLGTAAGLVARRSGGGRDRPTAAVACIVAGATVLLVSVTFFLPLVSFLLFLPLILGGGLIAVGVWGLRKAAPRDAPAGP